MIVEFVIELQKVTKTFGRSLQPAVRDVSLTVHTNSIMVLLGESGCGKTTTLKLINRLVEPTAGRILLDGHDISQLDPVALRRQTGYVIQGIGLFPHLTVAENIATVPRLLGWDAARTDARVDELLALVNLAGRDYAPRYPHELSGGQQQRVGVARALASRAELLLMDEPFGALDPITRDELQTELKALQRTLSLTIVLVTHDVTEALLLADHIAVMKAGRVLEHGTPDELVTNARDEYVRSIMAMPRRQAERVAQMGRER
jgi:osmoprotectant transport system ATP-binding protein